MITNLNKTLLHPFYYIGKEATPGNQSFFELRNQKREVNLMTNSSSTSYSKSTNVSPDSNKHSTELIKDQKTKAQDQIRVKLINFEKEKLKVASNRLPSLDREQHLPSKQCIKTNTQGTLEPIIPISSTIENINLLTLKDRQRIIPRQQHSSLNRRVFRTISRTKFECKMTYNRLFLKQYSSGTPWIHILESGKNGNTNEKITMNNFLQGHDVTAFYRTKMIDWMLLVITSFKKSSPRTFFLAVKILDKFFEMKKTQSIQLSKSDLHLYGLVSIFISSKLEDYSPIKMKQIVNEAGHLKFSQNQIQIAELDILRTLNYKLNYETIYDKAFLQIQSFLMSNEENYAPLGSKSQQSMNTVLACVCSAVLYKLSFSCMPESNISKCCIFAALKILAANEQTLSDPKPKRSQRSQSRNDIVSTVDYKLSYKQILNDFYQEYPLSDIEAGLILPKILKFISEIFNESYDFKTLSNNYPQLKSLQVAQLSLDKSRLINISYKTKHAPPQ